MGDVTVPGIGTVPKPVLISVGIGLVAFVGWRYWIARNDTGAGDDGVGTDPGFEGDGTVPGVLGAVSPTNSYGRDPGGDEGAVDSRPKTNAEWTNQVVERLQASDRWNYADIVTALGNYLAERPTTAAQQDIIRAAIAVGDYPPVGGARSLISGGNTPITVAPTGLRVVSTDGTSVKLAWNAVAGAASYRVYRTDVSVNVGTSTAPEVTIGGLQPNTTYNFKVSAFTASAAGGPASGAVPAKTKPVALPKPSTPTLSSISKSGVRATVKAIPNVDGYQWYLNNNPYRYSEAPAISISGLKSKTKYTVTVSADLGRQAPGPRSAGKTFTTR